MAKLPCTPQSLPRCTSQTAVAIKECLPNGEWFKDTEDVLWSNYSLCISSDGRFITTIIDLNFDRTEYEEQILNSTLTTTWLPRIKTVSQVGYATSFTVLIIAFIIFSLHRKLQNPRNRLHMHLFASFIMRAFMALLKDWLFVEGTGLPTDFVFIDGKKMFIKEHNAWFCKAITSTWQYCIIANYTWILMEGLYLHKLIFSSLCTNAITFYVWLGWGIPAMVVIPWVIVRVTYEDVLCWTINRNYNFFLIIRIPIMMLILFSFLLFLNIVRVLFVKLKTSVLLQRKKMQYRKWARSTLILVPLLGTHYTLFIGLSYCKDHRVELIWLFCDLLFGSFQVLGCFIALLYCFLNSEVKAEVIRSWKARKLKKFSESLDLTNRSPFAWLKFKSDSCRQYQSSNLSTITTT